MAELVDASDFDKTNLALYVTVKGNECTRGNS